MYGNFHDNNFRSDVKIVRLGCIFHLSLVCVISFDILLNLRSNNQPTNYSCKKKRVDHGTCWSWEWKTKF